MFSVSIWVIKMILKSYLYKNNNISSKLVLGGADEDLYVGDLHYHRVIDQYYWEIKADNILIGGKDIGLCVE